MLVHVWPGQFSLRIQTGEGQVERGAEVAALLRKVAKEIEAQAMRQEGAITTERGEVGSWKQETYDVRF